MLSDLKRPMRLRNLNLLLTWGELRANHKGVSCVPLVGPQGIFKPRVLDEAPLSATTAPNGPYDDSFDPDGLLRYRYRGTDPNHHVNDREVTVPVAKIDSNCYSCGYHL